MPDRHTLSPDTELFSPAERDRLVRLCAHLSGSPGAAEDLAQETLLEAWRSRDRLRDPAARARWLAGIARNVCRRWHRRQALTAARSASSLTFQGVEIEIADGDTLDVALEQSEVNDLLGQALGMLPGGARDLLVERYVEDLPVGEMAARRGIAEGTASVRLHRSRHALRRVLLTELREEAVALGLLQGSDGTWQASRIWCPFCGAAQLQVERDIAAGTFAARCPACRFLTTTRDAGYLAEVNGHWRALLRVNGEAHRYYGAALECGTAACACCGRVSALRYSIPPDITGRDRETPGVYIRCDCGAISLQPDLGLALTHPMVQGLWLRHRRMRLEGRYEIVTGGRDAVLIRFESVATAATAEVIAAADTFEVLETHGAGAQEVCA